MHQPLKNLEKSSLIQWLQARSKQPGQRREKKTAQIEEREKKAEASSFRALKAAVGTLDFILVAMERRCRALSPGAECYAFCSLVVDITHGESVDT